MLYQLSYVREARILAALLPSAFRRRRQLSANCAVPKRGIDARSQVAGERLEDLVPWKVRCGARCGIEACSNIPQPRSEPLDLLLEFLVGVDAVEQQRCVLRVRRIRIDDDRRARQRPDKPQPDAIPVLVPGPRRRVRTQFSVSRKSLVHAH